MKHKSSSSVFLNLRLLMFSHLNNIFSAFFILSNPFHLRGFLASPGVKWLIKNGIILNMLWSTKIVYKCHKWEGGYGLIQSLWLPEVKEVEFIRCVWDLHCSQTMTLLKVNFYAWQLKQENIRGHFNPRFKQHYLFVFFKAKWKNLD